MKISTYTVDSFTDKVFNGNPAGVCILKEPLTEAIMQSIAQELNLSETAFVEWLEGTGKYSIRYFSPVMEIPLCGHATLAASKILFDQNANLEKIHFVTTEGIDLNIKLDKSEIVMEFPIYDTEPVSAPDALISALGISKVLNSVYNKETNILLLEIPSSEVLESLRPNYNALVDSHDSINGVLVTALSNKEDYDFESRYFWPWSGSNEDPVTGGTHTFLTKYWGNKLGKKKMKSYQCSQRGGFMELDLINDQNMTIKSQAKTVFEGILNL